MQKLGVMCGSSDNLTLESKMVAATVIASVANMHAFDLVMGAGSTGIMRDVKEIMVENGAELTTVGIRGYSEDHSPLSTNKILVENSIERTAKLYEESDIILFLSGGFGSRAEAYSMIGRKIEHKEEKPIIIYNEDHSYDLFFEDVKQLTNMGLINNTFSLYYDLAKNEDELINILEKYSVEKRKEVTK